MSFLFRLIYATHANGTHHKLALDALRTLRGDHAEAWRKVFLKHAELYLEGSKAPDKQFKDFRNHVLHVSDNYWGGAPEKVVNWYTHTVEALKAQNWSEAVYSAGVLSHYYTDPIHPFHTAQSEAENSMHRAVEWSINRCYNDLRQEGEAKFANLDVKVPDGENWLTEMTCDGAETSHAYYEKLIAHYNLSAGVSDPKTGLDSQARHLVSGLLIYASVGFSHILDRAIAEAGVSPPDVNLTAETFLATVKIPVRWVEKKLANAEDRALVRAMWDELQDTGTVEHTLPEDDRMVRNLYKREVEAPKQRRLAQARSERVASIQKPDKALVSLPRTRAEKISVSSNATHPPSFPPAQLQNAQPQSAERNTPSVEQTPTGVTLDDLRELKTEKSLPRTYLKASDPVEDGPSVGPKTATRLAAAGIQTVQDLFDCDPDSVAATVNQRHITPTVIRDWQDQAALVIKVPGLRGTHAQLLVGAGYRDPDAIANADPADLSAAILNFAVTSEGQRLLRDGSPPDLEKTTQWISNARLAQAA